MAAGGAAAGAGAGAGAGAVAGAGIAEKQGRDSSSKRRVHPGTDRRGQNAATTPFTDSQLLINGLLKSSAPKPGPAEQNKTIWWPLVAVIGIVVIMIVGAVVK